MNFERFLSLSYSDPFPLAPYAFPTAESAGRRYPELPHPYRGAFQRDRDRIIHCAAFRRLSEKMQAFTAEFGDYHRTRLTHTMEVACAAQTIARVLHLNEDLTLAAAFLHDIGHTPFGHTGESILNRLLQGCGGFEHNAQALRIVEKLERRYAGFPGLNLSQELLDGQAYKITKTTIPLLEIQTVDIADSIAYVTHDIDDAVEIGLLTTEELDRTLLWRRSAAKVLNQWTNLSPAEFRRTVVHDLIETLVSDVLETSAHRLSGMTARPETLLTTMIAPSAEVAEQKREMSDFLMKHVYTHPKVAMYRRRVAEGIQSIFEYYVSLPDCLPMRYQTVIQQEGAKRAAADYIADQTDRSIRLELLKLSQRK